MFATTEGADKPAKYPHLVDAADLILLNKMDLMPYVSFDLEQWRKDVKHLKPTALVAEISASTGDLRVWLEWIKTNVRAVKGK